MKYKEHVSWRVLEFHGSNATTQGDGIHHFHMEKFIQRRKPQQEEASFTTFA